MDYTYKLQKLSIEEGKDSLLPEGYTTHGTWLTLYDYATDKKVKFVNIESLDEGWQVVLSSGLRDYHRTSKIKEILERKENSVKFKTQTSVYLLERLDDEK